jgi:hypothetical protein
MYVCMYVCIYIYIYTHTHTHTYIHTYIHTCIYIYTHTHTRMYIPACGGASCCSSPVQRRVLKAVVRLRSRLQRQYLYFCTTIVRLRRRLQRQYLYFCTTIVRLRRRLQRQYLYFCTTTASKLGTCRFKSWLCNIARTAATSPADAPSVSGLTLLVYQALSYWCMRP